MRTSTLGHRHGPRHSVLRVRDPRSPTRSRAPPREQDAQDDPLPSPHGHTADPLCCVPRRLSAEGVTVDHLLHAGPKSGAASDQSPQSAECRARPPATPPAPGGRSSVDGDPLSPCLLGVAPGRVWKESAPAGMKFSLSDAQPAGLQETSLPVRSLI